MTSPSSSDALEDALKWIQDIQHKCSSQQDKEGHQEDDDTEDLVPVDEEEIQRQARKTGITGEFGSRRTVRLETAWKGYLEGL